MQGYSILLRNKLLRKINEFAENKKQFVARPGYDFIRTRKLGFKETVMAMLSMGSHSTPNEFIRFQNTHDRMITTSAFVQNRDKINVNFFHELLKTFQPQSNIKNYKGYRLLAVDGSSLNTPFNPMCPTTFIHKKGSRGHNLVHINSLYDLRNRLYVDSTVQLGKEFDERRALINMMNDSEIEKAIVIADRGYESYNFIANIERKGWKFLVRIKDFSSSSMITNVCVPSNSEFDIDISTILTNKQTNYIKENKECFTLVPNTSTFDFLNQEKNFYQLDYRMIRLQLPNGKYEVIITNLERDEFSMYEISKLYEMRWGIETSFRHLKYALGLVSLHSKKVDNIIKEIYAKLLMYNFTELIISKTIFTSITKQKTKYNYQVNFSIVASFTIQLLRLSLLKHPPNIETIIHQYTLPIRPGRLYKRSVKLQSYVSFVYRLA